MGRPRPTLPSNPLPCFHSSVRTHAHTPPLPLIGWSHFAQFTIAVVNADPKKSKYSDTLHRFCKKEHDWGWKKFMELAKVLDGFTSGDALVIKAQVQVIRDRPIGPFRCLDAQYRRELVRVYLANVEAICRKFGEDRRAGLVAGLEGEGGSGRVAPLGSSSSDGGGSPSPLGGSSSAGGGSLSGPAQRIIPACTWY